MIQRQGVSNSRNGLGPADIRAPLEGEAGKVRDVGVRPGDERSPGRVRASYFICFTPRSGSTLLCDLLTSTGVAGRPEEYFHPDTKAALQEPVWRDDWRTKKFPAVLNQIKTYGTTPNGIFGSKLKWHELTFLDQGIRSMTGENPCTTAHLLESVFPQPQYIWITRRDKVRQAVSLYRARQSQAWIRKNGQAAEPEKLTFSYELIDLALRHLIRLEAAWGTFFQRERIIPYTVAYEDLEQDREYIARAVLDYLHIALPEGFSFPTPHLEKQADAVSEEWVERYQDIEQRRVKRSKLGAFPTVLVTPRLWSEYLWPAFRRGSGGPPIITDAYRDSYA